MRAAFQAFWETKDHGHIFQGNKGHFGDFFEATKDIAATVLLKANLTKV